MSNSEFIARGRRWLGAALLGAFAAAATGAAPAPVEAFDAQTWTQLRQQVERMRQPTLLMFSASWCAVCPGVLKQLAADPRRRRAGVLLLLVMSDLSPEELARHGGHGGHPQAHAQADRLFAFDGEEARIRHAVDPRWRGVVPHLVWLAPGREPEFVSGAPDAATLARWWAAAASGGRAR